MQNLWKLMSQKQLRESNLEKQIFSYGDYENLELTLAGKETTETTSE